MRNYDKLIFELSSEGRVGYSLPKDNFDEISFDLNESLLRSEEPNLPEVSELTVIRHYTNLSHKNFGVETGFYPLGSCTMKYNPKVNEYVASLSGFKDIHPLSDENSVQGSLQIYHEMDEMLSELTGLDAFSFSPFAGAHGELTGLMIIKQYHLLRNDTKRTKIIVPTSAHGTNPASAAVCGFDIIEIPSLDNGRVDLEELKKVMSDEIAGMMLTNPNTLGLFENEICEITKLVHDHGGLMYYDGANLNALLGYAKIGNMGFDVIHLNLHKTFSTPHGGGGPGSGPVGVKAFLKDYLPSPIVIKDIGKYKFANPKNTIGHVSGFYGNFLVVVKAYTYLLSLGKENIKKVAYYSVLNANYIKEALKDVFELPIEGTCMHEFVFDGLKDKSTGVKTLDVAKRLLDYGYHAPTIYFPLLFDQTIMIEPTEVESKETIDDFINVMRKIAKEAKVSPDLVKEAPHHTPVRRIDEVKAAKRPIVKFKDINKYD